MKHRKKKPIVHTIPIGFIHSPKEVRHSPHMIDLREGSSVPPPLSLHTVEAERPPQTMLALQPYRRVGRQKKYALKLNLLHNSLTLSERVVRVGRRLGSWCVRVRNFCATVFSRASVHGVSAYRVMAYTFKDSSARSFRLMGHASFMRHHKAGDVNSLGEAAQSAEPPLMMNVWRRAEVVSFLSMVCGLLLIIKAAGVIDHLRDVRGAVLGEAVEGVQALGHAQHAFSRANIPEAIASFLTAQERFASISSVVEDVPLSAVWEQIPSLRSNISLVKVGEASSRAAEYTLLALKALDNTRQSLHSVQWFKAAREGGEGGDVRVPTDELERASRYVGEAVAALREANRSSAAINLEDVPTEYRNSVASFIALLSPSERLLSQTQRGLALFASFLGADHFRRIIIIFQNDAELRPTGGFMGSYALIDTNRGTVTSIDVPGGGFYDLKGSLQTRVDAPYPFHLLSPLWQSWNANYFFDVPQSAQTVAWFIEKSQGPTVDGAIFVTPVILEDILRITGPLTLPEYQLVVNDRNVRRVLQDAVELHYDRQENQPKQIIGDLLPLILTRISVASVEYAPQLLETLASALDRHDVLLWSSYAEDQNDILASGWGGAVEPSTSDYLAVVHTNIGGGKTDRVMAEQWDRTVVLAPDRRGEVQLKATREHRGDPLDLYEKVHNVDYVRIFVPKGSVFLGAEGFTAPDEELFKYDETLRTYPELASFVASTKKDEMSGVRITEEHGLTVFGGWVMTKVGATSRYSVRYRTPPVVKVERGSIPLLARERQRYELFIQRQPGALDTPFTDTIVAPPLWGRAVRVNGEPVEAMGNSITRERIIDRDIKDIVEWRE
ncbi:MAG: DUF4012 domain-containing protein [Patescibacteria group bacterium]